MAQDTRRRTNSKSRCSAAWAIWGGRALKLLKHFIFLLPAVGALLLYFLLPQFPEFTEYVFSRGIFRVVSVPLGVVSSLFPFSLTELAALVALPAVVVLLVRFIRKLRRAKRRQKEAQVVCGDGELGEQHSAQEIGVGPTVRNIWLRAGKRLGWFLSCVLLGYMLLHGGNFYRQSAAQLLQLDTGAKSPEYLLEVTVDLAQKASAAREQLPQDEQGCTTLSSTLDDVLNQAGDGYQALGGRYPFLWGAVNGGKPVLLSHWWSYTQISGMYFPFFVEANINVDMPDSEIPATAAHELAHTRGFAREDECNFFACLSCFASPSADYRYSGYLMAYIYCSNALYEYDKELWAQARAYCSDGVVADLNQRNQYWDQFEGQMQEVSSSVNSAFLQMQGEEDGVFSYNRVVELLMAYYEKEGLLE